MANNDDGGVFDSGRILYVDEHCAVVNKIAGEAVEGASAGMIDLPRSLERALKNTAAGPDRLALPVAVHRLDVPVSGCALFARTQKALAFLSDAFRAHTVYADTGQSGPSRNGAAEKHYWAVIEKPPHAIPQEACLVHWIDDTKKNKSKAFDRPETGRKKAVLKYRLIGTGTNYLFLDVELITGRHHQIRCQLESAGLHIKGDLKYGARRSEKSGGIRLHARSLTFPDPASPGTITVQADPPVWDNLWREFLP